MVLVPEKKYAIPFIVGKFLQKSNLIGHQYRGKMTVPLYPFSHPAYSRQEAITYKNDLRLFIYQMAP